MSYCPECGTDHHIADRAAEVVADREVTLAKIEADKTIKVEQIRAGAARDLAETDNALEVARSEGKVEGMETVIDAGAVDGQAEEPGEPGEPIIVEAPEPEPAAAAADLEPPIAETSSASSGPSSRSSGWWDGYR